MDPLLTLVGVLFVLAVLYLLVILHAEAQERRFKELRQREAAMEGLKRISEYTRTKL